MPLRLIATLMVMMANQTTAFTQPLEMRRSVRANEVLLQAAAERENSPDMNNTSRIDGPFGGIVLPIGFPQPSDTAMEVLALANIIRT
jgi:hypothetical protein